MKRVTCDFCAAEVRQSDVLALTNKWSDNLWHDRGSEEFHFCGWQCLSPWMKARQSAYGWSDSSLVVAEPDEFRDCDVVEVLHGPCVGMQGVVSAAPVKPVKRESGNLVIVHWRDGHNRAADSELIDAMALKLVKRRTS